MVDLSYFQHALCYSSKRSPTNACNSLVLGILMLPWHSTELWLTCWSFWGSRRRSTIIRLSQKGLLTSKPGYWLLTPHRNTTAARDLLWKCDSYTFLVDKKILLQNCLNLVLGSVSLQKKRVLSLFVYGYSFKNSVFWCYLHFLEAWKTFCSDVISNSSSALLLSYVAFFTATKTRNGSLRQNNSIKDSLSSEDNTPSSIQETPPPLPSSSSLYLT
jgi:hypothetical protein